MATLKIINSPGEFVAVIDVVKGADSEARFLPFYVDNFAVYSGPHGGPLPEIKYHIYGAVSEVDMPALMAMSAAWKSMPSSTSQIVVGENHRLYLKFKVLHNSKEEDIEYVFSVAIKKSLADSAPVTLTGTLRHLGSGRLSLTWY